MKTNKPKILLIADVRNWIFARHCSYISELLKEHFIFNTSYHRENFGYYFDEDAYDLIYPLEFNLLHPEKDLNPEKYITGIRAYSSWRHWETNRLSRYLSQRFSFVHTVSHCLGDIFNSILPKEKYYGVVHHGVDSNLFYPQENKQHKDSIVIGWAGNRKAKASKGFEYIEPLSNLDGVSLKYCGYSDENLNLNQMADFHRSLDVYVCASEIEGEGHNNSLVESAFTQNALITTINGTVPEYLFNEKNSLIVERDHQSFTSAVERLRDDKDFRLRIAKKGREDALEKFQWKDRVLTFKKMFEDALNKQ